MNKLLRLGVHAWPVEQVRGLEGYAAHLDRVVAEGAARADLLLLPEYACMEAAATLAERAEPVAELEAVCRRSEAILAIMVETARRHQVWLMPGTLPWPDSGHVHAGRIRNRAPLIAPDGQVAFQDKHVMTRFEAESWGVQPGVPPGVFDTPWGKIGAAVCYDCEFPMLVRSQVAAGAWLVLAPSCTDTLHGFNRVRISAQARALENQCFVALAPTVGMAPWLVTLDENHGAAAIFGPVDRGFAADGVVAAGAMDAGGFVFATLDPAALEAVREGGAVRNFRDWPDAVPAAADLEFSAMIRLRMRQRIASE